MKEILFACLILLSVSVSAQTNLAGRVYQHTNIMEDEMKQMMKESTTEIESARKKAIAQAEEKKGRKLTTEELGELDEKIAEAKKMMEAVKKGMKMGVTITFKDATNVVMKMDMKMDDNVMKAAGISWAKRKLMKAAMLIGPSTEKAKYTVSGKYIYIKDDEDVDTIRLSDDGKYLYGKMDGKTKFKLTRIK